MSRELIMIAVAAVAFFLWRDGQAKPATVNAGTVGAAPGVPDASTAGSEQAYADPVKTSGLGKILEQLERQVAALPGSTP